MSKLIDLTGQKINHWTVLERAENNARGGARWKCQCNCKAQTIIITRGTDLRSGKTTSCGCIKSKGETIIAQLLMENNIPFEKEKTFLNCIFPDTKGLARFDFYIDNKYLIEFDGKQHYDTTNPWYSEINKKHDEFKTQWCIENNIPLIRIHYNQLNTLTIKDLLYE